MDFNLFTEIFDDNILPEIQEIGANNPLITTKNIDLIRKEIFAEYKKLNGLYKEQIFEKDLDNVLLDRHKIASCICGAFLKVSVFYKDDLIAHLEESHEAVAAYFYYVNEFIALIAASKFLSYFMVLEREEKKELESAGEVISKFPLMPPVSKSRRGFWNSTVFNMAQIKINKPQDPDFYDIGLDHYDMYSYAMYFFWLEYYYNEVHKAQKSSNSD